MASKNRADAAQGKLQKPDDMPRALFEKIKRAHEDADAIDKGALVDLLDLLTQREQSAHPAEAEFEKIVGIEDFTQE